MEAQYALLENLDNVILASDMKLKWQKPCWKNKNPYKMGPFLEICYEVYDS